MQRHPNVTVSSSKERHERMPNTQTPEWQAAVAAGLDMSLVELSLAKSFGERIRDHDSALAFALSLAPA